MPLTLLHIEDTPTHAESVKNALNKKHADIKIIHCPDHDELENFLSKTGKKLTDFDIIITDNNTTLSGDDGKKWLEGLIDSGTKIPSVIILSSDSSIEEFAFKNEFIFINKKYLKEQLPDAIEKILASLK